MTENKKDDAPWEDICELCATFALADKENNFVFYAGGRYDSETQTTDNSGVISGEYDLICTHLLMLGMEREEIGDMLIGVAEEIKASRNNKTGILQ